MSVTTRTYFAARGDVELRGLNQELGRTAIALDALLDFQASARNDGVALTILFNSVRPLFLEVAAPEDGAWFIDSGFASYVDMVFSAPVDRRAVVNGTFVWKWDGGEFDVLANSVVWTMQDRKARVLAPTLPSNYTGALTLSFGDLLGNDGERLREAQTLHYDITDVGAIKPQPGASAVSRTLVTGRLEMGRLVVAKGQNADAMIQTFIRLKRLENEQIAKVIQVAGPNATIEIFLLWWKATSPRVMSIAPRSSGTLASESPPTAVLIQFDQPVPNPEDYAWFDGVAVSDVAFTVAQVDAVGRQWIITKSGGLFATDGQHTLLVDGIPNEYGDLPGTPMLFSWQVLPLTPATGSGGPGVASVQASWKFDTLTTASNPGAKKFRLDNATLASATNIYLNDTTNENFDVGTLMGFLAIGDRIYVQQKDDATRAALFIVTAPPVDNTGWWTIPVGVLNSGTLYQNVQDCGFVISFSGTGSLAAYQLTSEKNAVSGYAGLDSGGIVQPQVQFVAAGLLAARPAPSIPGRIYFSTDTKKFSIVMPV